MFGIKTQQKDGSIIDVIIENKAKELYVLEMAMESGIDMIAKIFSKCEIKVIRKVDGKLKPIKDNNYYRLNLKPNANETGTMFWRKAIHTLFHEEELLIITLSSGDMFIATNFTKSNDVINGVQFSNVTIEANGNSCQLDRTFDISECLFLANNSDKAKRFIRGFNEMFAKLIGTAAKSFNRGGAIKFKAQIPGGAATRFMKNGEVVTQNDYFESIKEQLTSEEFEMVVSQSGIDYTTIDTPSVSKAEDVIKLVDKAIEITGFCLDIPIDIFIGKTTEKSNAQNDFITFSIDPLKEIFEDGFNTSYASEDEYLQGERYMIDTSNIMHRDILDVAPSLDKLFAQGFNHNEICELIGKVPVDEEWAYERYVTKNYEKGGKRD